MWSLTIHLVVTICICISNLHVCLGLQCLECKDLPNPDACRVVTTCSGDSRCFVEQFVSSGGLVLYNLGCMSPARCKSMNKRQDTVSTTDVVTCVDCCDGNMCNIEGCGAKAVSSSQRPPICFACDSQQEPTSCRDVKACDDNNICGLYMTFTAGNEYLWRSHCLPLNQCQSLKSSGDICVHCCTQDFCNNYCNVSLTNGTHMTTVQPSTTTDSSVISQTTAQEITATASTNNYQTSSLSSEPQSTTLVTSTIAHLSSSLHVVSAISTTAKPAATTSASHPLTSKLPHATSPVLTLSGCRTKPIDLCFVFHASGGDAAGHHTFTKEKQFATEIVNSLFSNDIRDLRICAVDFATDSHTVIHMNQFQTLADADNAITGIPYRLGKPNSHIALSNLYQEYQFHERPNAEKITVLMTDVRSTHVNETVLQAHHNTRDGIELYAVGVGLHDRHELQRATPQHFFVLNADQLNLEHVHLQQAICHYRRNCKDVMKTGDTTTDYKTIFPDGIHPISALCIMDVDGGGWTVIQKRESNTNFYRDFQTYKNGFGDKTNFWIGLENIYRLTLPGNFEVRIDMRKTDGTRAAAKYQTFVVSSEADQYRLSIGGYSYDPAFVNPGDSMIQIHNGMKFTTYDRDNDNAANKNCAQECEGAYWYNDCQHSNLNGIYGSTTSGSGMNWYTWTGFRGLLDYTRMMIRPK